MPKSMVSAEHYNAVKLERDGLAAKIDAVKSYLGEYSYRLSGRAAIEFENDIEALFTPTKSQSLLIHDAEALEHWAKVLSSSLVEGVPVHRMMSEAASLRLQAEDAKK